MGQISNHKGSAVTRVYFTDYIIGAYTRYLLCPGSLQILESPSYHNKMYGVNLKSLNSNDDNTVFLCVTQFLALLI